MKRFNTLLQMSENKLVYVPIAQFHNNNNNLKQQKPNQTLKNYLECNNHTKVLLFFRTLLREKSPTFNSIDSFSFLYTLKACINKNHSYIQGKQLHALIIKFGYESIIQLQTSLLKVYAEGGNLFDAHQVFDEIPKKNIICWTSLISAYVENHKSNKGLDLFRLMLMNNVEPDQIVLTTALSACADTGGLEMGEWIHDFVRRKQGMKIDLCLNNALINMYAKCGDIVNARKLFDNTRNKDVTTWTSMIVGHAVHGQAHEALQLFSEMNFNVSPNDVTFIGVLMACSHAGLVEEGKRHFQSMTNDYGIEPREPHFGCMVDLLCRSGHLREAYDFIMEMSGPPNAVMWRTLLGACSLHGDLELATEVRDKLINLDPGYVGDSVALSNIYADKEMWDKKIIIRNQIKQSKAHGFSSIEV